MTSPSPDLAALLHAALHEPDFRASQAAAHALAQQSAADLSPVIVELAEALGVPTVQRRAAQVLAVLGSTAGETVPALVEALAVRRWALREAVALALGQTGGASPQARAALVRTALHDQTELVREAASIALTRLTTERSAARVELIAALDHPFPRVRCRALRALALPGMFDADLLPRFAQALTDSDFRVRRAVAQVVGPLGSAASPLVAALLRRRHEREPRVQAAADAALTALAPTLPAPLQEWLRRLTGRGGGAVLELREALEAPGLPVEVADAFVAVCGRRARWHQGLAGLAADASPAASAWAAAEVALTAAAAHDPMGREQEAAWLAGWLWVELERGLMPTQPLHEDAATAPGIS